MNNFSLTLTNKNDEDIFIYYEFMTLRIFEIEIRCNLNFSCEV